MADPEQPICITRCDHITEAEMLKSAIESAGIDVTIDGSALNTTFGEIGGPMISALRLIVRREDAAEALQVIEEIKEAWAAPDQDPWFCAVCHEEIEGGFQVCWSCGGDRDEVAGEFPALADAVETEDFPAIDTDDLGRKTDNPYEAPQAMGVAEAAPKKKMGPDAIKAEKKMLLGLFVSIGSLLVPGFSAVIAGLIFSGTFRKPWPISFRAKLIFWIAMTLLILIHGAWVYIFFIGPIF